jgi:hypothetical protein
VQASLTVDSVLQYILEEPRVLNNFSVEQIVSLIQRAIQDGTLYYQISAENKIIGIVIGTLYSDCVFHVNAIKCSKPGCFRLFVERFYSMYPGCSLSGYRGNNLKTYDRQLPH